MSSTFYNTYKTPQGVFKTIQDVIDNNNDIRSRKMFYYRCKKYPTEWSIIKNDTSLCKGCGKSFNISIKKAGYCSSKCRSIHINYKINIEDYNKLLSEQNNKCAICKKVFNEDDKKYKQINIDHDHKTGKIRGILCSPCNRSLGLMKENVESILNMIKYLNKYK